MSTYRKITDYDLLWEVINAGARVTFELRGVDTNGIQHFGVGSMTNGGTYYSMMIYVGSPSMDSKTEFVAWCVLRGVQWFDYMHE